MWYVEILTQLYIYSWTNGSGIYPRPLVGVLVGHVHSWPDYVCMSLYLRMEPEELIPSSLGNSSPHTSGEFLPGINPVLS